MIKNVSWMHPSYRDLVIEELIDNPSTRTTFLERTNITGIKLAISDTGGELGDRSLPLLVDKKEWELLKVRAKQIASQGNKHEQLELLVALTDAASKSRLSKTRKDLMN